MAAYQARLEAELRALVVGPSRGEPISVVGPSPGAPISVVPPPAAPALGGGRPSQPSRGLSRRWLLTLGAVSAAGLGVGGWRLGFSGGPAGLALGPSTSPSRFPGAPSTGKPGKSGTSGSGRTPLWSFPAGGQVQSDLAVANGVLYAGTNANWVYALDAVTGARLWAYQAGSQVQTGPVVYDGMVYAADMDGTLYALDAATGARRWHFSVGPPGVSEPVPGHGLIFLAGEMNALYVLEARTGAVYHQITTEYALTQDLVGAGVLLYTGHNPGGVLAFRQDGTQAWRTQVTTRALLRPMAVTGGVVYVPDTGGTLHALDATTGATRWTTAPPQVIGAPPAVVEAPPAASRGMVAMVSGTYLYAFRASDGRYAWKFNVGGNSAARPAASNGLFYLAGLTVSGLGAVYALDPGAGRQVWSYTGELGVVEVRHRRGRRSGVCRGRYREHPRAARVALAGRSGRHGAGRWRRFRRSVHVPGIRKGALRASPIRGS